MNVGFSNLLTLKQQLLAEALREGSEYDEQIKAIGLGVAAQFEKFCNRKFLRTVGATFICPADRDHVFLDRPPVESVASVELHTTHTAGWETQTGVIENSELTIGYIYLGTSLWSADGSLRFTFTGGYWWDTDEGNTATLPSGATALPDDLKLAWLMQCREIWTKTDKLGTGIIGDAAKPPSLAAVELLPQVTEILNHYRRFTVA